jgi:hypothetical protein
MKELQRRTDVGSWVALVGVCHGLFEERYDEARAEEEFGLLGQLLP